MSFKGLIFLLFFNDKSNKDFQEYEQKNNSMTIEGEDTNSNHNYFDR